MEIKVKKSVWRWLLTLVLFVLGVFFFSEFELFERLHELSRKHATLYLGGIFSLLIGLGLILPVVVMIRDERHQRALVARRQAEKRARFVARHDPLTGLLNRRVTSKILRRMIREARAAGGTVSVLLMDLDRFKPINDLRGHDIGDEILREFAGRLRGVCGDGQIPVRVGGDEFAVLMRENDRIDVSTGLARLIQAALEKKFVIGDHEISLGASIGIAVWTDGLTEEKLFRNADQAMYRAKREGRGGVNYFDDTLGEKSHAEAELEVELTKAIENAEIIPFFQPIVDISDRHLVGFEVLARWHHARLGDIPPTRFIALAEDTGQINAISWLILRQACRTARRWPEDLSISFNLSPRQFRDADLATKISEVLEETDFPPSRLEIEITESAVVEDLDYAHSIIEQLRWLGIRTSLDDFGTGFSSLATLSCLPFDKLKIDRSFVSQVTKDAQKVKIVAGIISIAESLGLSVTAEGIETEDICALLADLNCDLGQGYLFERPLPGDQVEALLQSGKFGFSRSKSLRFQSRRVAAG